MVLIRLQTNDVIIACSDNIILCNVEGESDRSIKIPDPILPENLTKGQADVLKKETRTITSLELSKCGNFIAVATENKQVVVYNNNFEVLQNFIISRTASKVCFTSNNDLLVADKTGDVYLYKLDKIQEPPVLLLGHLSIILDVVLSECGKYIISCDRDEKIRVSRFPNAYHIVNYCLGHTEFVVALKLVKNRLVSASGDGTVRFWDYVRGRELGRINSNDHLKNNSLLEGFACEMDGEKVDVTALPITDMQVYDSCNLFIILSIHKCNFLQLYATDLTCCKSIFLRKIDVVNDLCGFGLQRDLYILGDKFRHFRLVNEHYETMIGNFYDKFYEKYRDVFKPRDSACVTVLYKRKFDNVQEYLERKRQRLEASK